MTTRRHQFHSIRLRDFRCFHDEQTARMAPLTLLVGDNSTGKTSFLAAVRAIWEVAYRSVEPDFRAPPYDLGAFSEIAYNPREENTPPSSFEIGFVNTGRGVPIKFDVTFRSQAATPFPTTVGWESEGLWIKYRGEERGKSIIDFGSKSKSWRLTNPRRFERPSSLNLPLSFLIRRSLYETQESDSGLKRLSGSEGTPSQDDLDKWSRLVGTFDVYRRFGGLVASAPIRSSPRRTYEPTKPSPDPEGAYVPTYLANLSFREDRQWIQLKERLEEFGRDSGLFHEIGVKQLGDMEGGPFHLEVRKYHGDDKGRNRNLIDVGYGVSQVLPVVAELFRPEGPKIFLFQQPEVHLHPSAQAALGSLFCERAASGRQLIVETHSDYVLDRIMLDIRDRRTRLKPEEVSILYFERNGQEVVIHSICVDRDGNAVNTPDGYRNFFKDELERIIGY